MQANFLGGPVADGLFGSAAGESLAGAVVRVLDGEFEELERDLGGPLEHFATAALIAAFDVWQGEALDGFVALGVLDRQVDVDGGALERLEVWGCAILVRDQRLTPARVCLDVERGGAGIAGRERLRRFDLRLGEPGGGRLGISGPEYGESKYAFGIEGRLDGIEWAFHVVVG